MKKVLLLLAFSCLISGLRAQNPVYLKLLQLINENGVSTNGRMICLNLWSMNDKQGREANTAFDKAIKVYEFAKLNGGEKGCIGVSVSRDELSGEAVIVFNKDGNTKLIPVKLQDFDGMNGLPKFNTVFDNKGNVLYTDLEANEVFNSIHKLVTR